MKTTVFITNDSVYQNAYKHANHKEVAPEFKSAIEIHDMFLENKAIRKIEKRSNHYDDLPQGLKDFILGLAYKHYDERMEETRNFNENEKKLSLNRIVVDREFLMRMAMYIIMGGHLAFRAADIPIIATEKVAITKYGEEQYKNTIKRLTNVGLEVEL